MARARHRKPPQHVGRIWLCGPNGKVAFTANYQVPPALREAVLHISGGIYQQCRQELNGTYVYRYEGPLGHRAETPHLTDFRTEQSAEWDGPRTPPPAPTMREALLSLDALIAHGSANASDLRALTTLLETL